MTDFDAMFLTRGELLHTKHGREFTFWELKQSPSGKVMLEVRYGTARTWVYPDLVHRGKLAQETKKAGPPAFNLFRVQMSELKRRGPR